MLRSLLLCLLFCVGHGCLAQVKVTLQEMVLAGQQQSPQYRLLQTQREYSYYEFLNYKSSLKPQVSLYGNLPSYNKQYAAITQPDGTIYYLPVTQNTANLGFSLSQQLPFSGGTVSFNSNLSRFDDLLAKMHQYNGTPFFIQLNQPLFAMNANRWDRKIAPLKLEESKREFVLSLENIAMQVTDMYFNILDAQEAMKIATANLENITENYGIEYKRIALGTTTEDKLLQLKLQQLTNKQNLELAAYNYQVAILNMKTLLGSADSIELVYTLPDHIPDFEVDLETALNFAQKNRPEFIAFERKRLEADKTLASARSARQQVSVSATFGINRASTNLGTVYTDPKDQQTFSIGFNIPIIDWGRRSIAYNTAKAAMQLTMYNNEIDELNFSREITTLVKNMALLRENIALSRESDTVAQSRYQIANRVYQMGKLSVSDLNIAQNQKDQAHQGLLQALRAFWYHYYLLRRLTLYDFEHKKSLFLQ